MRAGVLLVAILALMAAAAHAATPFQIDRDAAQPDMAIDSAGTAHVVWDGEDVSHEHVTHYCRILRGRRGCAPGTGRTFAPQGYGSLSLFGGGPHVLFAPGRVLVVMSRCCTPTILFRFASADGGATFDGGLAIGNVDSGDATLLPAGVATLSSQSGALQLSPPDGPQSTSVVDVAPGGQVRGNSLGATPDGRPVVAWSNAEHVFAAVPAPGANMLEPTAWRVQDLGRGDAIRLAAGGGALWLAQRRGTTIRSGLALRRFGTRTGTFGRQRVVVRRASGGEIGLAVDARGEAHVVYRARGLRYRRTTRRGERLTRSRQFVRDSGELVADLRLAVGRGRALAIWRTVDSTVAGLWLRTR